MSGTTIATATTLGVVITAAGQLPLSITSTGSVRTGGFYAVYVAPGISGSITNQGLLSAGTGEGIALSSGGSVINGSPADLTAQIIGGVNGVDVGARGFGSIVNYATIATTGKTASAGILLEGNGSVVNGSNADTAARVTGYGDGIQAIGPDASIANFGLVQGQATNGYGIYLRDGGGVTNGSNADTAATIRGVQRGLEATAGAGTIVNYGTIIATETTGKGQGRAVGLAAGGSVVNGSNTDTLASLLSYGANAIYGKGVAPFSIVNWGRIHDSGSNGSAILIRLGGTVVNGGTLASGQVDTAAAIYGTQQGVVLSGLVASAVQNFGTITGHVAVGVDLLLGGTLVNGSPADSVALIQGYRGAYLGGASVVTNYGTIQQTGASPSQGLQIVGGGSVTNGSAADRAALITGGRSGVLLVVGTASVTNYGIIRGGIGVSFYRAQGHSGATLTGTGTVVNAGTIASTSGTTGIAIHFGTGAERLVELPGAVIQGRVLGGVGSNTLELAAGQGGATITGLGSAFSGFTALVADAGSAWTLAGTSNLAGGGVTLDAGSVLTATGAFAATALSFAPGAETLALGSAASLSATISGFGAVAHADVIDLLGRAENSASFAAGVLTVTGPGGSIGLHFAGAYLGNQFALGSDGHGGTAITFV